MSISNRAPLLAGWPVLDMVALLQFVDRLEPAQVGFIPACVAKFGDELEAMLGVAWSPVPAG